MSDLLVVVGYLAAVVVSSLRWMRVAQREHYEPGRVSVFALRWWPSTTLNVSLIGLIGFAAVAALFTDQWVRAGAAIVGFGALIAGPVGLGIKGRTSPLAWTRRLRVVAAITLVLNLALLGFASVTVLGVLVIFAQLQPGIVDLALAIDRPIEKVLSKKYIDDARERVRRVGPNVIAITGSYGKTSTKNYVAHLLGQTSKAMASRKSFNNRLGLAMSVNNDLEPGTEHYIAEMGTYGPGEIAALCEWLPPRISAITAIGPVHLERMGSLDNIAKAKSEILEPAGTVVLNVDDERLAALADQNEAAGKRVIRSSTSSPEADVLVVREGDRLRVRVGRDAEVVEAGMPGSTLVPSNLGIALGLCLAADAVPPNLVEGIETLPSVDNRLVVTRAESGVTLLDDTYNANPAGAAVALERLVELGPGEGEDGKLVVITPGMVELGPDQIDENRTLGRRVAEVGAQLVVVGATNRAALVAGCKDGGGEPVTVSTREQAIAWMREHTSAGDAVLFENDLPDHFA